MKKPSTELITQCLHEKHIHKIFGGVNIMKKPELDLSKDTCHVCKNPLIRDMENQTEKCIHFACLIRNINFSIPYVVEKKG